MNDQSQKAGADSVQVQAGRDIIVGVTAEEVVSITRTEIAQSVELLTAMAKDVAEARVKALGDGIIDAFCSRPELYRAFADPDFQFALRDAARAVASTDDEHTEQLLVDLLTNRAEEGSTTRVRFATGQAIRAADKLMTTAEAPPLMITDHGLGKLPLRDYDRTHKLQPATSRYAAPEKRGIEGRWPEFRRSTGIP